MNSMLIGKLKIIYSNDEFIQKGKELVDSNIMTLGSFDGVKVDSFDMWEIDPHKNRSWQWRFNWLSFISFLIAYHHKSKDERALNKGKEAIASWLEKNIGVYDNDKNEFAWHDHCAALRAEQMLFFLVYCLETQPGWSKSNEIFIRQLKEGIFFHGLVLSQDSFFSKHTNHGLEQTRVLLYIGCFLGGNEGSEWCATARERLLSELHHSFTGEGVHVENSPGYHVFVFRVFMQLIMDFPRKVLGDLGDQFNVFSDKALQFITYVLRPDCTLPIIGDTEQYAVSDVYGGFFKESPAYMEFLYARSAGKKGKKPDKINKIYPKSGYAIFRDFWNDAVEYHNSFHIIVKVGCLSRYHHQQDEGTVVVFAGGEDWLIDSGMYNYIHHDPVRKYMRSRLAHNVPQITHARYAEDFEHRLTAWEITDWSDSDDSPYISMHLSMLQPVTHSRTVSFRAFDRQLAVNDRIFWDDKKSRTITMFWHIPIEKHIRIVGDRIDVLARSGSMMRISLFGDTPDVIDVATGRHENHVFSCVSYRSNTYEQSQVVRMIFRDRKSLTVNTRFLFTFY